MADKKISKDAWVAFTKKSKLSVDDAAFVKALEKFDKTGDDAHEARASALDAIVEQAKKQVVALAKLKKEVGDKLFNEAKDKLYEVLGEAEKQQKESLKLAAEAAAKTSSAAEDEEDSPSLLTTAMIPLVRQLQKGEVQMSALIAIASKKVAVLIMRRPVSPSRRKMMAEYLQETGSLKYITAQCSGAAGQLEFQLNGPAGGLSKKLRLAVFEQTGLRCRVLVRFGEESETDGAEEETDGATDALSAPGAATAANGDADAQAAAALALYQARLEALQPRLVEALRTLPDRADKLRALQGFADGKAEAGQYVAASKALEAIETLLTQPAAVSGEAAPAAGAPAVPGPQVFFTRVRLDWDATRKLVQTELQALEAQILAESADEPDAEEIRAGTKNLYGMLDTLDERLIDTLDEALNAADVGERKALHARALEIVGAYRDFIRSDTLLRDIDDNGFLELEVRETLDEKLAAMAAQLDASLATY